MKHCANQTISLFFIRILEKRAACRPATVSWDVLYGSNPSVVKNVFILGISPNNYSGYLTVEVGQDMSIDDCNGKFCIKAPGSYWSESLSLQVANKFYKWEKINERGGSNGGPRGFTWLYYACVDV